MFDLLVMFALEIIKSPLLPLPLSAFKMVRGCTAVAVVTVFCASCECLHASDECPLSSGVVKPQ